MPHSNFHPELEISADGSVIKIAGPLESEDGDDLLVSVSISAVVTQAPERRGNPPAVQQGPTGTASIHLDRAALRMPETGWAHEVDTHGGPFREDWAFATAEMVEKAADGGVEKYVWSQWVWLRHP